MIAEDQPKIFSDSPVVVKLSSLDDGEMHFDRAEAKDVLQNYKSFLGDLSNVALIRCTYDAKSMDRIKSIESATELTGSNRLEYDSLTTNVVGITLALPVADCVAMALYDPTNQAIAILHLGWRATKDLLVRKTIEHMQKEYNTDPKDLIAYLSPSIDKEQYVFADADQKDDPVWNDFIDKKNDGYHLDIKGFNVHQLESLGVVRNNIEISSINTATSSNYGSHYAKKQNPSQSEDRFLTTASLS